MRVRFGLLKRSKVSRCWLTCRWLLVIQLLRWSCWYSRLFLVFVTCVTALTCHPGVVSRITWKTMRTVLCCIVYCSCAQWATGPISLVRTADISANMIVRLHEQFLQKWIRPVSLGFSVCFVCFLWWLSGRLSELFCAVLCTEVVHSHKHT